MQDKELERNKTSSVHLSQVRARLEEQDRASLQLSVLQVQSMGQGHIQTEVLQMRLQVGDEQRCESRFGKDMSVMQDDEME